MGGVVERADLVFSELGFGYQKTDRMVRFWYRDGAWSTAELTADEHIPIHIASVCIHYGQAIYEGLKAYERPDGRVHVFRLRDSARRIQHSARRLVMEPVPETIFQEAVQRAVAANRRFLPPYGSGASLYIRPLEIGISPELGLKPSRDYLFTVYVSPVGPYFQSGLTPTRVLVEEGSDRAAPAGVGDAKAAGNYAASLRALTSAKQEGFNDLLYLDARERKYIDEFSASNFFGIRSRTFVTPDSPSVLASITNVSVRQLAADLGLRVEQRRIPIEELPDFDEVGALGTAAVITPVGSITYRGNEYVYGGGGQAGAFTTALYERLTAIQTGRAPDIHGWCELLEDAPPAKPLIH